MKNTLKKHFKVLLTLAVVCAFSATGYYFFDSVGNTTEYQAYFGNPACPDGYRDVGEECDDNNASNFDSCLNDCTSASCGDGYLWAGKEQCDDGNTVNDDSCTNACASAACGDGIIQSGETCDDGNTASGDGCSSSCAFEYTAQGPCGSPAECNEIAATFTEVNIADNLELGANATVGGDATITGILDVGGNATVTGALDVIGTSNFADAAVLGVLTIADLTLDNLTVNTLGTLASLTVSGATNLNGTNTLANLTVTGASTLSSLTTSGALTANGNVTIGNAATDTLTVNGTSSFEEPMIIWDNLSVIRNIYGGENAIIPFNLQVGNISANGANPSVVVNDKLEVTGDIIASDDIYADDDIGRYYSNFGLYNWSEGTGSATSKSFQRLCASGDVVVHCGGNICADTVYDKYLGTSINNPSCVVLAYNGGGASTGLCGGSMKVIVDTVCFSPDYQIYCNSSADCPSSEPNCSTSTNSCY